MSYSLDNIHSYGRSKMTFPVPVSLSDAKALSKVSSIYNPLGRDAAGNTLNDKAAGGRQAPLRKNIHPPRRKLPALQHVNKVTGHGTAFRSLLIERSLSKDDRLVAVDNTPEDINGRRTPFNKKCERLERTRTFIPPLPRDYVHRPGNLHRFGLPKELSPRHLVLPFNLGSYEGYDLNTSPAFLLPSALVLNGRNTFPADNCKFNRPKVNYRPCNLFTIKNNEKRQTYPDPMLGAPHSFIHRISELSCLEGETVRQEKLKKMRKAQNS